MEQHLTDAEESVAELIWQQGPMSSGQLVALCAQRLGWKKFLRNAAALLVLFFLLGCVLVGLGMLLQ